MSVHLIYYQGRAKMMRPVLTEAEYRKIRNTPRQKAIVKAVRKGDETQKRQLVQMNYSCLPCEDGKLKGSRRQSNSVGMDIDHVAAGDMEALRERILGRKEELGLLMMERSARGMGYHLVFRRHAERSQEENLQWASDLLGVKYDDGAKDITRVFFTTTAEPDDLLFLDPAIFEIEEVEEVKKVKAKEKKKEKVTVTNPTNNGLSRDEGSDNSGSEKSPCKGMDAKDSCAAKPNERIRFIVHGVMQEKGLVDSDFVDEGGRHTAVKILLSGATQLLTKEEVNGVLQELMPEHWRDENIQQLVSDFYLNYTKPSQRLFKYQEGLFTESRRLFENGNGEHIPQVEQNEGENLNSQLSTIKMPQGVKESVEAVGEALAMPALTAICPCIGALATGVTLDVHGQRKGLNLISYIAGDFASGKGLIDPVVEAWMSEVAALDKMYQEKEDEWRAKKRAAKNKKEQPEEPKLPVRCLTLNNTVANLAERLANTEGKHAFSFTPEADTVAQKWKSTMSDFSVMLRQSYDGSRYDREARSAEAVNVHIEKLLWNVTMCGTPDALYRVVSNYTDGFQSRIAVARTPDNTFVPLEDRPPVLTELQRERIEQVAHLLMLMNGEVELPKLEAKGREWVERVRVETMKNDDKVKARQRFRICVTAQRMTCCLMLCKVAEQLIVKHGYRGAEKHLKESPDLWKEWVQKVQTPQMLTLYDLLADYLMDCALYFFRNRIEAAFNSREYAGGSERKRIGKNDSIYARLDPEFGFENAMQHSVVMKGANVTRNQVEQMLKNWRKQGLIVRIEDGRYRKVQSLCSQA